MTGYVLLDLGNRLEIRRADSSWVFTLRPEDREFAQQILANLNGDGTS